MLLSTVSDPGILVGSESGLSKGSDSDSVSILGSGYKAKLKLKFLTFKNVERKKVRLCNSTNRIRYFFSAPDLVKLKPDPIAMLIPRTGLYTLYNIPTCPAKFKTNISEDSLTPVLFQP